MVSIRSNWLRATDTPERDKPTMDIAIFAKAPQPGAAKTRLIPALGAAGAARLQRRIDLVLGKVSGNP